MGKQKATAAKEKTQKEKLSLVVYWRWTPSCGTNSKPITDEDNSSGTLRSLGNCTHLGCCRGGNRLADAHTCACCACGSLRVCCLACLRSPRQKAWTHGDSRGYFSGEFCCTTCVMKQGEGGKNVGMKGKFSAAVLATSSSALSLLKHWPLKYKSA